MGVGVEIEGIGPQSRTLLVRIIKVQIMADHPRSTVEFALTAHSKKKGYVIIPLSEGAGGDTRGYSGVRVGSRPGKRF